MKDAVSFYVITVRHEDKPGVTQVRVVWGS